MHEGADGEPKRIGQGKLVFDQVVVDVARVGVVPFVRGETGDDEHCDRNEYVGREDVQPDLYGQGVHEREQPGFLSLRHLRKDKFNGVVC